MSTPTWLRGVAAGVLVLVGSGRAHAEDPPGTRPQPVLVAQLGHGNTVTSVACSPDGKWLATASYDRSVLVWERESGREVRRLKGHDGVVCSVAFSADGQLLLTASFDKTARLWERETGREVRRYPGSERLWSAAFSADGRAVVVAGDDKTARLFDRDSGTEVRRFQGHGGPVTSAALSPDGRFVLTSCQDGSARLFDRESGAEVKRYAGHTGTVASAAFSADGRFVVTAGHDKTARLFDRDSGAEVKRFQGHTDRLTSAALSADGRFAVTGGWDSTARLWDRESGKELQRFAGHENFVAAVGFCPDGQVVTASYDKSARLWDPATGKEVRRFMGRADFLAGVAFSRDGRWCATASEDGFARLWDRESGQEVRRFQGHVGKLTAVAFSPDARFVATAGADRTARLWDRESGSEVRRYEGHTKEVTSLAFAADGAFLLTGSEDQTARLWERESGREVRRFEGHGARVTAVALTADGRFALTAGHDKTARCWDRASGQELRRYQGHGSMVAALAVSPDGRQVLTGSYDKSARLWDRESGRELRRLEGHTGWVDAVAFAPGGTTVLTGSLDGSARLWDAATGVEKRRFEGHSGWVSAVAFSPEGRWILTGGTDSTTRAWETESGRALCTLISFRDGTWAVVDADGRYDGSSQGRVTGLHWVLGQEAIALEQLQSAYFEPGLLGKVLRPPGSPPVARIEVPDFRRIGLFPALHVAPPGLDGNLRIDVENRGGGIGRVVVKIDGAAVAEVGGGGATPASAARETYAVPLAASPQLAKGRSNRISVEVYNAEGSLRSRGLALDYAAPGTPEAKPPALWGVVAGVSKYANESITLRYASKDAEDFATAISAAAKDLFGADHMHLTVLTTAPPRAPPTRANLVKALEDAKQAGPDDVFLLYLAGHGVTHGTPPDYFFLTQEAVSTDASRADVRQERAVSAKEIEAALRLIPARKRIVVFDTCRAGAATAELGSRGDDPGEQTRVIARLRQAMGTYVLAGCAADRVSYEASRYAQGLVTYALLEAMKTGAVGAVREGDLLEAGGLLQYAMRRVPQMARGLGGIQDPQLTIPDQATPIDLGRVTPGVRAGIRLAGERPLFGLPDVQQSGDVPGDPQGLARAVQKALEAASEGRDAVATYVPTSEGGELIRIAARYTVTGDVVKVRVYLRRLTDRDPLELGNFELEGHTTALPALARRLVAQAAALANRQ